MPFWSPSAFLRSLQICPLLGKFLRVQDEISGAEVWLHSQSEEAFRTSPVLIPPPSLDFCAIRQAQEGEGFCFLVCREEREERKKSGVLLRQRTGNKWGNPGKAFASGNVAACELGYFNVFSEGAGLVQALPMAKGSLRGCSPALPTLLLGMGVCGGKFQGTSIPA